MNRIILIGNGFDLAHGLKTSYKNFIDWYWNRYVSKLSRTHNYEYEDELCKARSENDYWDIYFWSHTCPLQTLSEGFQIIKTFQENLDEFQISLTPFMENICNSIENKGWIDIEKEYYTLLKQSSSGTIRISPEKLNRELDALKLFLREYLIEIQEKTQKDKNLEKQIEAIIDSPIKQKDASIEFQEEWYDIIKRRADLIVNKKDTDISENIYPNSCLEQFQLDRFIESLNTNESKKNISPVETPVCLSRPGKILLLDFNYTKTSNQYCENNNNISVIHIHGSLENEKGMIFGYGDELDDSYKELMKNDDREYMKNIKSVKYTETDNYRNLLSFAESAPYQILILGHSCGKSDGTLLNTLFEHKNCISIKPYYYQPEEGKDNYADIVQDIAKNFTDMKKMRDLVVNKTYCEPIPQSDRK